MRPSAREVCDILAALPYGDGPHELYEHPESEIEGQQPAMIEEDDAEGGLEEVGVLGNGGGHYEDEILETVPMSMSDGGPFSTGGALETREVPEASLISTQGGEVEEARMQTANGASVLGSLSTHSTVMPAHTQTHPESEYLQGPGPHQVPAPMESAVAHYSEYSHSPFAAHVQSNLPADSSKGRV